MTRRTQWSAALLLGGLSLAGLITASVAVSQDQQPPVVDPTAGAAPGGLSPGLPGAPPGKPEPAPPAIPAAGIPAPQFPAAGAPGLPAAIPGGAPATVPRPGLAIDVPPAVGRQTPTADSATDDFVPQRPRAENPAGQHPFDEAAARSVPLRAIQLKHVSQQSLREIIETLMPTARGLVVGDARTNTLLVRVSEEIYQDIEQLVRVLDVEAPVPKGTGAGATNSMVDKPATKSFTGTSGTGVYHAVYTGAAELRHEYERHNQAAREFAEVIKRGSGTPALQMEFRERVADAFVARQKLLRFELAELQQRMKASQESIDLRDRVAKQIIERRINELLDPSLQWEPASSLISETGGGMRGPGQTSANRPTNYDVNGRPIPPSGLFPTNRTREEEMFREGPGDGASKFSPSDPQGRPVPTTGLVPTNPTRGKGASATFEDSSPFEAPDPGLAPLDKPLPRGSAPAQPPRGNPSEPVGTLRGRVIFEGAFTIPAPLYKKGAAPKDTSICGADEIPDDRILVNHSNGLANVFVYLEKAPAGITPPPVTGPLIFDQSGCIFQPRALIVRTEQVIQAFNSDPIAHNVHTYPIKSAALNMVLAPNDNKGIAIKYPLPEKQPFAVGCDIHPWMQAYHLPLDHSFGAVTDTNGEFEIQDLPAGTHKFKVWHEVGKTLERALEVTIKSGDNDVQIRVKPEQLNIQPAAPGRGPMPKPAGKSVSSVDTIEGDPVPRKESLDESRPRKI